MAADQSETRHASAVAVDGRGVLIIGAPGSGKSTLALDLISRGASLIADDQVRLVRHADGIELAHPTGGSALIEARGIGILDLGEPARAQLFCLVDLDHTPDHRLPRAQHRDLLGVPVPVILGGNVANLVPTLSVLLRGGALRDPDSPI